jgi:(2Fe-2S) ferredoxin
MTKLKSSSTKKCVLVCQNASCLKQGSDQILFLFKHSKLPENIEIIAVECQGQCSIGPTVRIIPEETWYYRVTPDDVTTIVIEHLQQGKIVEAKLNPRIHFSYSI